MAWGTPSSTAAGIFVAWGHSFKFLVMYPKPPGNELCLQSFTLVSLQVFKFLTSSYIYLNQNFVSSFLLLKHLNKY